MYIFVYIFEYIYVFKHIYEYIHIYIYMHICIQISGFINVFFFFKVEGFTFVCVCMGLLSTVRTRLSCVISDLVNRK